jgi:Ca2+/Na+ antiporter
MATKVNFKESNPKKDSHFKKFIIFLLIAIVLFVIGVAEEIVEFLVFSGIVGIFMLYNFIMYRYNK